MQAVISMLQKSAESSKTIRIIAKPNSKKAGIIGYDKSKKAYIVALKEHAEKNKANKELIKFLSKILKKDIKIKSGMNSREKVLIVGK